MEKGTSAITNKIKSLPFEHWKAVPGFSRYLVSSEGRIFSFNKSGLMRGQLTSRRVTVQLSPDDGNKPKRFYLHRLVANLFIPNPRHCDTVDHIDGDIWNNRVSNLQWLTSRENIEKYMHEQGYWYNPDAWHRGKPPKRYACPADSEGERWLEIDGHPGYYISDQGRVWSVYVGLKNTRKRTTVQILKDGARVNKSIRQLVASAFLRPGEEGERVGFSNKDHTDCRASNLYWYRPYKPMSHKRGPRGPRKSGGRSES